MNLVTPPFRLCFPALFEPTSFQGSEPKYQCVALFEEDALRHPKYQEMEDAIRSVATEKWGEKAERVLKSGRYAWPLRDAADKTGTNGFLPGRTFCTLKAKDRPDVLGPNKQMLTSSDDDLVFPGAKARAIVRPFAYDRNGNRGVSLALIHVQIVSGATDRLDNRPSAEAMFEAVDEQTADALF